MELHEYPISLYDVYTFYLGGSITTSAPNNDTQLFNDADSYNWLWKCIVYTYFEYNVIYELKWINLKIISVHPYFSHLIILFYITLSQRQSFN